MIKFTILISFVLAIFSSQVSAQYASVTHSQRSYVNTKGKIVRVSGFIGLGSTAEEALKAATKACRKGTFDYNGRQNCGKDYISGPAKRHFVVAICSFGALHRAAVGTGRSLNSALSDAQKRVSAKLSSFNFIKKRWDEKAVLSITKCRQMRNFHKGKRTN